MTDHHSAIDQALDLVLYAPLGLAVTIAEELPELAEKGRTRLSQRTAAARLIGQLAVAEGRRRLRNSALPGLGGGGPAKRAAPGRAAGGAGFPEAGATAPGPPTGAAGPGGDGRPARAPGGAGGAGGTGAAAAKPGPVTAPTASAGEPVPGGMQAGVQAGGGAPASGELAIPGYDSLSASQVVQRLASLSGEELEAVRAYEAANRGRRTILARVAQLQRG